MRRPPGPVAEVPIRAPSPLLLALEGRAAFEWAACAVTWPLLRRAPRGDGHPVLVLPGLMAGDLSTWPLRAFLAQCGYVAYPWELGLNVGPRDNIVRGMVERVRKIQKEHKRKVSLIGWSLGGAMAHALAARMPAKVRSVITLGSPLGSQPRASNVWRVFELVSGLAADDPRLQDLLRQKTRVPHTAFLSKTDGVVAWRNSLACGGRLSENIEVTASHLGLGVNPAVWWAIADRLAQREGSWAPFERSGWRSMLYGDPKVRGWSDLFAR
ncbi:MAG: alpha/beta fold hydrolase [Lysobacterales bacterium]